MKSLEHRQRGGDTDVGFVRLFGIVPPDGLDDRARDFFRK
jgi:hypothetical protein